MTYVVRANLFALANWATEEPQSSMARYYHLLDRYREAFTPFDRLGTLEVSERGTKLESMEGLCWFNNPPPHTFTIIREVTP